MTPDFASAERAPPPITPMDNKRLALETGYQYRIITKQKERNNAFVDSFTFPDGRGRTKLESSYSVSFHEPKSLYLLTADDERAQTIIQFDDCEDLYYIQYRHLLADSVDPFQHALDGLHGDGIPVGDQGIWTSASEIIPPWIRQNQQEFERPRSRVRMTPAREGE